MALQLESLIFDAKTDALEQAVKKIDNLSAAVTRLNKAQQDETKTAIQSEKLNEQESKSATASTKAKKAEAEAEKVLTKAKQSSAKATKEVTESTNDSNKVLQRQKEMLEFMTQGYSRGQSSTLAYAKATGAATSELNELGNVLKTQRKLIGGDVFDKSLSGLTALRNQLGEVREAYRQYGDGVELTRNQTRELARDKERIIERLKQEGASFTDIKNAIREHGQEYITTAAKVNKLINQEKELERQQRERANATRALAAEEERMVSIVNSMNHVVDGSSKAGQAAAVSIARYERNLRLAGVGAQDAAKKLALYKTQMMQVQEIEQNRRAQHLSRALTPQISDVVTSIAGGMPLHLVIMQQGLQIRDMINLSGVEMNKLQEVFRTAAGDMIKSLAGTAKAIGTLLVGSIVSAGTSIRDFLVAPFKIAAAAVTDFNTALKTGDTSFNTVSTAIGHLGRSTLAVIGILKVAAGAFALLGAVAFVQLQRENDKLVRALHLTGAAMGMSRDSAFALARSFQEVGVRVGTSVDVITEMAKQGLRGDLAGAVIYTANIMKDVFGVSIEDTVKKFKDLQSDPVKALINIGKETGNVSAETIRVIANLVDAGKGYEAIAAAAEYARSAQVQAAQEASQELGSLQRLGVAIANTWKETWDAILNIGRRDIQSELANTRKQLQQAIEIATKNPLDDYAQYRVSSLSATVSAIEKELNASRESAAAKQKESQAASQLEGQLKREDEARKLLSDTATKGLSAQEQKQLKLNSIYEAYRVAIVAAQGDQQKMIQIVDQYNKSITAVNAEFAKKTKATKEDNTVTNAYTKAIDDFQKMQVKASGTTDELSKAQTHLLNIMRSDEWSKWSEQRKIAVLEEFKLAHAAELTTEAYKKQEKALEGLQKLYNDMDKVNLEWSQEIELQNVELEFQYSLIGKSEGQVKSITKEYEVQRKILEINNRYEKQKTEYAKEYSKLLQDINSESNRIQAEEEYNRRVEELGVRREEAIANVRDELQLQSLQEYERAWQDIKSGVADALYSALFEGGKKGSEKIRDLIRGQLKKIAMEPINIMVNLVMNTGKALLGMALNYVTGGSTGGGLGSALGLVSNANSAYNLLTVGSDLVSHGASVAYANYAGSVTGDPVGALIDAKSVASWFGNKGAEQIGTEIGKSAGSEMASSMGSSTSTWAQVGTAIGSGLTAYSVGQYVGQEYGTIAGTAAGTLAGAGTYAVGSYLSGASATLTAGLASIPVWGWIALAAMALFGTMGGSKPKTYGDFVSGIVNTQGEFSVSKKGQLQRSANSQDAQESISSIFAETYSGFLNYFDAGREYTLDSLYRTRRSSKKRVGRFQMDGEDLVNKSVKNYSLESYFNDVMSTGLRKAILMSDIPSQITSLFEDVFKKGVSRDTIVETMSAVIGMNETLKMLGTNLASFIGDMNFDDFRLENERNIDVISRVILELMSMNTVFEKLSLTLFEISSQGYKQIQIFTELMGGQEEMQKTLQSYYENYFTAEEKRVHAIAEIESQLAMAGADISKLNLGEMTRKQYRELVEATVETRGATDPLSIALLKLSNTFASLTDDVDSSNRAIEEANRLKEESDNAILQSIKDASKIDLDKAFTALRKSIEAEKKLITDRYQTESNVLRDRIKAISDVIRNLDSALRQIQGTVDNITQSTLESARAQLNSVVSSVRAGADISKFADVISESSTILTSNQTDLYGTRVDFERQQRKSIKTLTDLKLLGGKQLTESERQVQILENWYKSETTRLDNILAVFQSQIDAINGVDSTDGLNAAVLSVEEAIKNLEISLSRLDGIFNNLADAIVAGLESFKLTPKQAVEQLNRGGISVTPENWTPVETTQGTTNVWASSGGAVALGNVIYTIDGKSLTIQEAIDYVNNALANNDPLSVYLAAVQTGISSTSLDYMMGWPAGTSLNWALANNLPAFASGGYYSGGMALVGEEGPELINFNNPGQVYTAGQTASMLSGDNELIEELKALRSEVAMLRYEARATAINTSKSARILDDVSQGGTELRVVTTP